MRRFFFHKRQYFLLCVIFFVNQYTFSPAENSFRDTFSNHLGILYSLRVFWNSVRLFLNMERDTFVLEEALLLHESWIYARPDGWHEKKVSVLKGFCLFLMRLHIKARFLVQKLTSSNVISEFCVIDKANGCECNCCHQWDCSSDFSWISLVAS